MRVAQCAPGVLELWGKAVRAAVHPRCFVLPRLVLDDTPWTFAEHRMDFDKALGEICAHVERVDVDFVAVCRPVFRLTGCACSFFVFRFSLLYTVFYYYSRL